MKKYWLRGAIVGLCVSVILSLLSLTFTFCWDWGTQQAPFYCHVLFPVNGTIGGIPGMISVALYIFYGAIVGWLYGKIKNSKV